MSGTVALPSERAASDKQSVASYIQSLTPEIQRALPRGMNADRVARVALTVVRTSDIEARKSGKPENSLMACSPQSFAGALLTAAALGLEPGVNGEAYLVPYRRECQLIIGYQGYCKLFWQNPLARHVDAQPVFERDEFDYAYGTEPYLRHKPARGDRGDVVYYYAVASLSTGGSSFVVLTPEEVKKLRNGKVGPSGNIADPMRWMERKTVLRQLVKTLPRSTMLNHAMTADEELGSTLNSRQAAASITAEQIPDPDADYLAAVTAQSDADTP
jgi:recombination protein RecT